MIQNLIGKQIIKLETVKMVLEVTTLASMGYINLNNFNIKSRRFFTFSFFAQKKFNLSREENEGFAKLIIELNQPNITESNYKIVKQNIDMLIGYFSLCPNRVLDFILGAFEANLSNPIYMKLLQEFGNKNSIT